jgi:hypothetical protein
MREYLRIQLRDASFHQAFQSTGRRSILRCNSGRVASPMTRILLCSSLTVLVSCAGTLPAAPSPKPRWFLVEPTGLQTEWKRLADSRAAGGFDVVPLVAGEGEPWNSVREALRARGAGTVAGDCVVLAGDVASPAASCRIPGGSGSELRMAGRFTDAPYATGLEGTDQEIAVGRLPARNPAEARIMVEKIINFETASVLETWHRRVGLMVGNPSATSETNSLVDSFVASIADQQLRKVHPAWTFRCLAHVDGNAFQLPGAALHDEAMAVLTGSYALCVYLGHSDARTLVSKGREFFGKNDWEQLPAVGAHGVLFSTGCNALECSATESAAYGYAALRSAGGPVAYIGAVGESHSAMGFLALGGIVEMLSQPDPPERLGEIGTLVRKHLAQGRIDAGNFALMDEFDGSQGKVPLDKQRLEHLEMWQLLGDPGMAMPRMPHVVSLSWANTTDATGPLSIEVTLPDGFSGAAVTVTLERPLAVPRALNPVPAPSKEQRDRTLLENLKRANQFVLATVSGTAEGNMFHTSIERPPGRLPDPVVIRAVAVHGTQIAQGTLLSRKTP